jgi:hypothetical protein
MPPPVIQRLPLDLLRNSLASQDPEAVGAAAADFDRRMSGESGGRQMLPRSMVEGQWKRGEGGANTGPLMPFAASAQSFTAMMAEQVGVYPRVGGPRPPVATPLVAATDRGAIQMPEPTHPNTAPVLRRVLPNDPPPRLQPPNTADLDDLVDGVMGLRAAARSRRSLGYISAMDAIQSQHEQVGTILRRGGRG